jgi:peptidyl-prolyl cis-trans isomerase D
MDREKAGQRAMSRAEDVLKMVRQGESFKQLALRFSQDPGSAAQGGDLGWFPRGVMLKPFEDAAFSLAVGEVSKVVKTDFGYHVIKLEERREAGLTPLDEVAASIKARLKGEKAREAAETLIEGLQGPFINAKSVEELEKAVGEFPGVRFTLTPGFYEDDRKVLLARDPRLRDIVFTMNEGDVTRPVETAEGFYIIKILERVDPHVPEYSKVSAKVRERLGELKSKAMAGKSADEFLKKAKGGEDFEALAKAEGLTIGRTGLFSRADGFVPGIGAFISDNEGIFDLSELVPYYPNLISLESKFYVLKLKGVKEAGEGGLANASEALRGRLQAMKEDEAVGEWLQGLRAKAEIKVFEERL